MQRQLSDYLASELDFDTAYLTPIINIAYHCDDAELKKEAVILTQLLNSIQGIELNSSQVITNLNLGQPIKTTLDGDHRRIGLWVFSDPDSMTRVAIWSDGHKKNPSRGTSYEVRVTKGDEAKAANFIQRFTDLLCKGMNIDINFNPPSKTMRP